LCRVFWIKSNEYFIIMYTYEALVTGVYDGDTITVDMDLGFGVAFRKQKIRLANINEWLVSEGYAEYKQY